MRRMLLFMLIVMPFLLGTLMIPRSTRMEILYPEVEVHEVISIDTLDDLSIADGPSEKEIPLVGLFYALVNIDEVDYAVPPLDYVYFPGTSEWEVMTPEYFIADDTLVHTYELGPKIQSFQANSQQSINLSFQTKQLLYNPNIEPIFGREFETSLGYPLTYGWSTLFNYGYAMDGFDTMMADVYVYYEVSHFEVWELDPFFNDFIGHRIVKKPIGFVIFMYGD